MPTAAQIDRACRDGFFVHVKGRQVSGAQSNYHGDEALPGNVHVYMRKTGLWEEVSQDSVVITSEPFEKEKAMLGKRAGGGHTGLPSESKARAERASKKKPAKENGKSEGAAPAEASTSGPAKAKKKGSTTVTVSRTAAKQGELPGVQTSKRKIPEIETLAEELEARKDEKKAADERFKDAEENLIVSMKKHERVHYSRSTWGSVTLQERKESAKFKREKQKIKE